MNTDLMQETWKTPVLKILELGTAEFNGQFYVSKETYEKFYDWSNELAPRVRYLRYDGTWHGGMDLIGRNPGGTYFKTLEEVIEVLCKYEIDVVGPDEEE